MLQIIYASAAVATFSELELAQLLMLARKNNKRLGVTGMLLYLDASFLQVLEGDEAVLKTLFERISVDPRHDSVVTLLKREVEAPHFGDWAMGFVSPKDLSKDMPGYSDYLRLRGQPNRSTDAAARMLACFRDGRFRRHVKSR